MRPFCVILWLGLALAAGIGARAQGVSAREALALGPGDGVASLPSGAFADMEEITVEGWVKWNSDTTWARFFDFGKAFHSVIVGRFGNRPDLQLEVYAPAGQFRVVAPGLFRTNEWQHLAATLNRRGEARLYFNGALVGSRTDTVAFNEASRSERNLFGRNNWRGTTGSQATEDGAISLHEVRVWNRARNAKEIRDNMFGRMTGAEEGLVCLLKFEGGQARDVGPGRLAVTLEGAAKFVTEEIPSEATKLPPLAGVGGRILDRTEGPVAGALIEILVGESRRDMMWSGAGGEFELWTQAEEEFVIKASSQDLVGRTPRMRVSLGQKAEAIISLHPKLSIVGNVSAFNKTPLLNALVNLRSGLNREEVIDATRTDARGRFVFETVSPGEYHVGVHERGREVFYRDGEIVRVGEGQPALEVNFEIMPPKSGVWQEINVGNGLPSDLEVRKILFEPNGVVWIATLAGAARWDGVDFEVFGVEQGLPDEAVYNIARDTRGNIWFSTYSGIARYDGKTVKSWSEKDGLRGQMFDGICADHDGSVWFSSGSDGTIGGQLFNFDGERFRYFGATNGLPGRIYKMTLGKSGEIWMTGPAIGLTRFDRTNFTTLRPRAGALGTDTPSIAADGSVWFGSSDGVWRYNGASFKQFGLRQGLDIRTVLGVHCAPNGAVWVAGRGGVARFDGTNFYTVSKSDGAPFDDSLFVTGGPDGAIWIGTFLKGAVRYEPDVFESFTVAHGIAGNRVLFSMAMRDGKLWFSGNPDELMPDGFAWDGSRFSRGETLMGLPGWKGICAETSLGLAVPMRNGLAFVRNSETKRVGRVEGLTSALNLGAAEGPDGSIWVTGISGISRLRDGKWRTYTTDDGLSNNFSVLVTRDAKGRMWFGNYRSNGALCFENEQWKTYTTADGLAGNMVTGMHADADGSIWFATDGGLSNFKEGRFTNYTKGKDRLPHQVISAVFRDSRGVLWVGTPTGAARFDGKVWSTLRSVEGLVDNTINTIIEDKEGAIWFGTAAGLTRYVRPQNPAPTPAVTVLLDKAFSAGEVLPPVLKGRRVQFRADVGDAKTRPETRRFLWGVFPGKVSVTDIAKRPEWRAATPNRLLEWTAPAKGDFTVAVQYVDRDLNYSEPALTTLRVVPPWYMNAFIAGPMGAATFGLLGWAFIARSLYMQKRREAERLREQMHDQDHKARVALEAKNRELEEARVAADAANRSKSYFLANMSHELRTPLNAIIGYSEMLKEEAEDLQQDSFKPDLEKINTAGKHLLMLINDILDLSKIEAGKMTVYLEDFDLPMLIKEVASTVQPLIAKNSNKLVVECAPDVGTLRADQTKVKQILFNLLSNASKFTKEGTVTLKATRAGDSYQVEVGDTGIGMSAAQLGKVFDAFTQADDSTTRKFGGTGLGLTISRRFAQMMGGTLSVASEEGKGSKFTVTVPISVATDVSPAKPGPAIVNGKGSNVLVIDDDPGARDLMTRFLAKEGYTVHTAASADEGIARARELRPSAITLDILMPGRDGWSALAEMKSDPAIADIPVILVTMVDDDKIGLALGAAEFVPKPIDWPRMLGILHRLVNGGVSRNALVIEDDPVAREMLQRNLERDGWQVTLATNGVEGVERLNERKPDVVLLDLMMPRMDGFEFMQRLRSREETRGLPVIVVTAKELTDDDHQRLNGEVIQILQKGQFEAHDLRRELNRALNKIVA